MNGSENIEILWNQFSSGLKSFIFSNLVHDKKSQQFDNQ